MRNTLFASAAALVLAGQVLTYAQDVQPLDTKALLDALKQIKEQNEAGLKSRRMSAYQQVAAAAASSEKAVAFWKDAVKAVQFMGAKQEGEKIRDWREGDGEALNDRLCANAVRLHLNWLALNLQHAAGIETKVLMPKVLEHTAAALAAHEAAEHFAESLEKAKDRGPTSPGARKTVQEDGVVKRVHDQIMRMPVSASPVTRWLQMSDIFADSKRKGAGSWEQQAGNVDGIYQSVILPEYRAAKDPRLLEYWDMVLKREGDKVAERKLDIEQRDWMQIRRPALLWARAQDVMALGLKNRAISDMFAVVRAVPQHPEAPNWIAQLMELLAPGGEAPASTPATTPIATPVPGATVPAPVAVPPATGGAVPRAAGLGVAPR
jgi:hypothetical protein